ncbi:MAG: FAD-binding oxidoreductase [Gemmatimonadota bacterium]
MPESQFRTTDEDMITVGSDAITDLGERLRGEVMTPDDPGYDEARAPWNGMIDRRPALIAGCKGADDVVAAIRFARDQGLEVAVRGGGHNIAGNCVCEGGLMIDLSPMSTVEVQPDERTARVGPGATLAEMDGATQAHGLATPLGINSTTGIAGLTLGGGFGWLSRVHGLTVDNLASADVVTADGEKLRASDEENPDLFWALRGGGGNFGVVTSFEYRLHDVGPEVLSGLIVHPFDRARSVLDRYREFTADAPDEVNPWFVLRKAPPLPFLPEDVHGQLILILPVFVAGDLEAGKQLVAPLRAVGEPIADVIGPHPYAGWQQAFDPLLTPGARNYWKSHNFTALEDGALDAIVDYAERLPSDQSEIFVGRMGGAANQKPGDATAYPHRDVEYVMNVHSRWEEPGDDDRCIAWAREFFGVMSPYATGGVYVNFMPADETGRVEAAFGPNYDRLARLKKRYDPDNFFHLNQNIAPAGDA